MPKRPLLLLLGTLIALLLLTAFGVRQYQWNVSALFHMDVRFGELHSVPSGVVLYEDAGYDGMLYYQVARDIPALFSGAPVSFDSPYRYQRILLPLFGFVLSAGRAEFFPYVFLLINLVAALGALTLLLKMTKSPLHSLTVVFNPAILVGILYSVTEPLSLFFVVLFFFLWKRHDQKLDALSIGALILSLLARETTIFLIAFLFLWSLWKKQWKEAALTVVPLVILGAWQYFLTVRLGSLPLGTSSGALSTIPFHGPVYVLLSLLEGFNINRLSSIGLLFFLVPLTLKLGKEWTEKKFSVSVTTFLMSGLCLTMYMMDAESIWGAITSIGRVVTPLYPVYALYAAEHDTKFQRILSGTLVFVSLVAAIGIAWMSHPFHIS